MKAEKPAITVAFCVMAWLAVALVHLLGVHRAAISLEGCGRLVAGCFSQSEEKNRQEGQQLGLDPERVYATFSDMALAEAGRNDPIPDP